MDEALIARVDERRGGWRTFPFIMGCVTGVNLTVYGVAYNLLVYLIQQFNISSIDATKISNIFSGCLTIAPFLGAVVADAGLGCFAVMSASSAACFLGMLLFTLTAALPSLKPPLCSNGSCEAPTMVQLLVLYIAMALMAVGLGGTQNNGTTMGASQFDIASDRASFFSWFYMGFYVSTITGMTVIVYIEDDVGWVWGFGLCAVLSAISLLVFLLGNRYYRHFKSQKNPFMEMLRAMAPTVKRKSRGESSDIPSYYNGLLDGETKSNVSAPDGSSDQNNQATTNTECNDHQQPCTDDIMIKIHRSTVLRLLPLMSTCIPITGSLSLVTSLTTLQALVMDRHLGPHFLIPAASMTAFAFITAVLFMPLLEMVSHLLSPLRRIGLGHCLIILAMVVSAMVELRRLQCLHNSMKPMSVLWLVLPLILLGMGQALYYPGQLAFFYQEFPVSLRSSVAGMIGLFSGIGVYLSAAVLALVQTVTDWLQDETNQSRLDNVYWMLAVLGSLNFVCFLFCARLYHKTERVDI